MFRRAPAYVRRLDGAQRPRRRDAIAPLAELFRISSLSVVSRTAISLRVLAARPPWLLAKVSAAFGFGVVGASGVVVNQLILWLVVERVGVYYLVAAILATVGSTTSNFLLTEFGVFGSRRRNGAVRRYFGFWAVSLASLPVKLPVLFVLTSLLGVHYLISNLAALSTVFLARFVISDQLIWRKRIASARELAEP